MTFRAILYAYIVGGLTFLPLLSVIVIALAWHLLPRVDTDKGDISGDEQGTRSVEAQEAVKQVEEARQRQDSFGETAASGTFAVLRQYDFQASVAALNARNNPNRSASGTATPDGSGPADGSTSAPNESVYQTMYRSVFAGNRNTSTASLLHDEDDEQTPGLRRKSVPASVMHIILRHGHLMFYDSPAHVEVKYVISLAHHIVSLQAAKDGDDADETKILEADLFTKRTAIVLTPTDSPNGAVRPADAQKAAKPYYLFCATNIDKEDFYRALLYARAHPPTPRPLDTDALVKLQKALHSSLLTPETRALNAIIGRIFLGVHKTPRLINFVRSKIEKKISRIQKPSFIPVLEVRSLELGDAGPVFSNLRLRDLNISGDLTVSADMRYSGGLSITLLAVAKLDLGTRFKTRTVDLVLKASIQRIQGTMLLHVKSAPTNRMWFCFETMPELEVKIEPVVSERKITYGFVLRALEERVRTAFGDGLVKPNWDDIPMPLQDTRDSHARGSLWLDDGALDDDGSQIAEQGPDAAKIAAERVTRALSTTDLLKDNTASSTGLSSTSEVNLAKLRHAATMPASVLDSQRHDGATIHGTGTSPERSPLPPKPLRSPPISSTSPSVAMNGQSVEPVRADDATLRPAGSQRRMWLPRGSASPSAPQRDALEGLRDLRARAEQAAERLHSTTVSSEENAQSESTEHNNGGEAEYRTHSRQFSEGSISTAPTSARSFSTRSSAEFERPAGAAPSSTARGQQFQQKKANILAAAGAATNAAKSWGWSTYQKNKGAFQRSGSVRLEQGALPTEPIGRGQPLPPPGQPLPGPNRGMWSGVASMRKKPVPTLPQRSRQTSSSSIDTSKLTTPGSSKISKTPRPVSMTEDEFGIWHENSGDFGEEEQRVPTNSGGSEEDVNVVKQHENNAETDVKSSVRPRDDFESQKRTNPDSATEDGNALTQQDIKQKKVPPALPVRREKPELVAEPDSVEEADAQPVTSNENSDATIEAEALHVPESAAEAIAAENATPSLAHGATDDDKHIDGSQGIDAEVVPNDNMGIAEEADSDDAGLHTLQRTATEERFARGEDVTEEDFEDHERAPHEGSEGLVDAGDSKLDRTESANAGSEVKSDSLSERIRAQVQKHTDARELDEVSSAAP